MADHIDCLRRLKEETRTEFLENIQPYWLNHSVDVQNGGFFGVVDFRNQPDELSERSAILNARILWTFSLTYQWLKDDVSKRLAKRAYDYFVSNFIDRDYNGIFWMLDHTGKVSDDKKHVYVQAFAIYGLTEYYAAFEDMKALKLAVSLYHILEEKCSDSEYGGYFEAYTRAWNPNDDVRLSEKDENVPKSMNTHLHVLEAYTNLYRHIQEPALENRLKKLIDIFLMYIVNEEKASLNCFLDVNWKPMSDIRSYGHDIETTWLLLEAAEVLGDEDRIQKVKKIIPSIADEVINNGMDPDGGLINERNGQKIIDDNKDWWPQAEAMVGFLNIYKVTGDQKYLQAACNSWEFIKKYIVDQSFGEWFEKVSRNGSPYNKMDKIRAWKAPYHNTRAIYEVNRMIDEFLSEIEETPETATKA